MRELKLRERDILSTLSVQDCIEKLKIKTIKMLQSKLGNSLNTSLLHDSITEEYLIIVKFEKPLPKLNSINEN